MMELSDLKLTSEQCEELLKLSHWSIAEAACYFHGLRAINLRNKLSEEFKCLTETEKILDINEVIAAAIEFFQEVPEMKSRYNSNYLNRDARIAVDDLMLWANNSWCFVQGNNLPAIVQLYNIRTFGIAIPSVEVIVPYTNSRLEAAVRGATSHPIRALQGQTREVQTVEELTLANTDVGTVMTDSSSATKIILSNKSQIVTTEQGAILGDKAGNPLKLSKMIRSEAKQLIDKGVALGSWIDLCHSTYESFCKCVSNPNESKKDQREKFYKEVGAKIDEKIIANGHTATYWPIVLFNFFEASKVGGLAIRTPRNDQVFEEISLDSLFDPTTVLRINELLKGGVRLDVWIDLCYEAYQQFWPKQGKPVPISEDERKGKYEKIRAWFPKKRAGSKGNFGSMNKSRLPEVLYYFFCPESPVGRPCNVKNN